MYTGVKQKYDDIITMRALRLYNPRVYTGRKLSILFGLSKANAEKTISGRIWKNIYFPIQPYASEIAVNYLERVINE